MNGSAELFYDDLAEYYHLIFEDWDRSIARQAAIIGPILERYTGKQSPYVLDCACGIGTQALGLAQRGHLLVASDLSQSAIQRAQTEAAKRRLRIQFCIADMKNLAPIPETGFDAVLAVDNALPHLLSQTELVRALIEIAGKLGKNGVFLATIRDYDRLILSRPSIQPPAFYPGETGERIVHQVWRWQNDQYEMHLYLTIPTQTGWLVKHFSSGYRALLRSDLNEALQESGFNRIVWLEPDATSFYQPIVVAIKD
jgi:SAM-dependent methyltransferase